MGGTIEFIDPSYEVINKQLMKLDATVDSYLKNIIKPHFTYSLESVCEKDSREVSSEDRERLVKVIEMSPHENILITHGTYTMKETAKFLDDYFKDKQDLKKKIILTGSMIPIIGFSVSDAPFNLGYCIASYSSLDSGVYLSMNGGIFGYNEVDKNTELLRFE